MLIANNINNNFSIKFSDEWIYPKVEEQFIDYFNEHNGFYKDMISYLNSTIIGVNMLGLKSDTTKVQNHHRGKGRTFQGSLHIDRKITKTLDLTFALKHNYLNYFIIYANFLMFNENKVEDSGMDIFLPPMILDVMDSNGNILVRYTYEEIQMVSMDGLNLRMESGGVSSTDFSISLKANVVKFRPYFNNFKAKSLGDQFKHNKE